MVSQYRIAFAAPLQVRSRSPAGRRTPAPVGHRRRACLRSSVRLGSRQQRKARPTAASRGRVQARRGQRGQCRRGLPAALRAHRRGAGVTQRPRQRAALRAGYLTQQHSAARGAPSGYGAQQHDSRAGRATRHLPITGAAGAARLAGSHTVADGLLSFRSCAYIPLQPSTIVIDGSAARWLSSAERLRPWPAHRKQPHSHTGSSTLSIADQSPSRPPLLRLVLAPRFEGGIESAPDTLTGHAGDRCLRLRRYRFQRRDRFRLQRDRQTARVTPSIEQRAPPPSNWLTVHPFVLHFKRSFARHSVL